MSFFGQLALPERLAGIAALWLALAAGGTALANTVVDRPASREVTHASPVPSQGPAATEQAAAAVEPAPQPAGAVVTKGPAVVRSEPRPDAPARSQLRGGILLPVTGGLNGHYAVMTPCQGEGWVAASEVDAHPSSTGATGLNDAVIVLDAGHGGFQPGAVGPTGVTEAAVNLDIVRRLRTLLEPSGARVFLTRNDQYAAGLAFRTQLASSLNADAFLSVHNNAGEDGPLPHPGTETFYQLASPASKRLAGLAYEEIFKTLSEFDIAWVGERDAGAKYRANAGGDDYYGILRRTDVPAVLVEAMFISNAPEEGLLRIPELRQRLASALHRALVRYFTTSDAGSGFVEPYPRGGGPSGRLPSSCVDPA